MYVSHISSLDLPSFSQATSELDWLRMVNTRLLCSLPFKEVTSLWSLSKNTVARIGDVFWDADEYDACLYCHLAEEGCPNSTGSNPVDSGACDIWYGDCPGKRILNRVAVEIFASILSVALERR